MRPRWSHRLSINVGMALAVLAGWVLAPSSVRAGCGDYVTMEPHSSQPSERSSSEPSSTTTSVKVAIPCPCRPYVPVDGPIPCPGCSAPSGPQSATAPASVVQQNDWAVAAGFPAPEAPNHITSLTATSSGKTIHQGSGIFHPPRFSFCHRA